MKSRHVDLIEVEGEPVIARDWEDWEDGRWQAGHDGLNHNCKREIKSQCSMEQWDDIVNNNALCFWIVKKMILNAFPIKKMVQV